MQPLDQSAVLLERARNGDRQALEELYQQYFHRIALLARKFLNNKSLADANASDVALSALATFCRRFEANQFPDLHDQDSLWKLLARITFRKASNAMRRQRARGGERMASLSLLEDEVGTLSELVSREPDPADAAAMLDQRQTLMDGLPEHARKAILWRMDEDLSNEEIADRLGVSIKTVERTFKSIRHAWTRS